MEFDNTRNLPQADTSFVCVTLLNILLKWYYDDQSVNIELISIE